MKALYIILGVWILITGLCTIAGITELDQVTAGMYASCLGLLTLTEGFGMWRK
jgi:hypothetical protein